MKTLNEEISRIKSLMGLINEEGEIDKLSPGEKALAGSEIEQVLQMPISQFVDQFSTIASDPKVQAVLNAGQVDPEGSGDDKIGVSQGTSSVKDLKPTQNEIGASESLKNILTDPYNSLASFLDGNADVGPNPIVTYNGEYIIDGHHRWSQVFAANPDATIPTLNLEGKMRPEDILKLTHLSVAAGANGLPLSSASGQNLLEASPDDVYKYVTQNLNEKAANIWNEKTGVKNPKELAKRIVTNVKALQANGVMKGAPPRTKMPQTDAKEPTKNVINRLTKGVVNFNNPSNWGGDGKEQNDKEQSGGSDGSKFQ